MKGTAANAALAAAIGERDWTKVERLALELLEAWPYTDANASAWAMVAITAAMQRDRAQARGKRPATEAP